MNKIIYISTSLVLMVFFSLSVHAQVFEQGTKLRDLGYQFQKLYKSGAITFEKGVAEDVGLGGRIMGGYNNLSESSQAAIQFTGAYHFGRILNLPKDNLDLFVGIGIGLMLQEGGNLEDEFNIGFLTTPNTGVRYFLSDKFGFFGRFGIDMYKFSEGSGMYKVKEPYRTPSFTIGLTFRKLP